ncbi:MAG: ISNCY family transposase [Planctomycetes bacterium]|nr:ISNCY family transposase [Planctomycetota bacterium]
MNDVISIGYNTGALKLTGSSRRGAMRKTIERQLSFGGTPLEEIVFDTNCRHEIVPILVALQHLYKSTEVRNSICELIKKDVLGNKQGNKGCSGLDYWEVLVLASVRLGCNLDYDALHDLGNNHRKLREMMGLGPWDGKRYPRSTIHSNIVKLSAETLKKISDLIVEQGHLLSPDAVQTVRGDSVVVKKNIHHPTDTNLIYDGVRKTIEFSVKIAKSASLGGWRQQSHLLKKIRKLRRKIEKTARRKGDDRQEELKKHYEKLITETRLILERAMETMTVAHSKKESLDAQASLVVESSVSSLVYFILATETMCCLADRRVLQGEKLSNMEKLYSLFEPYTELINRGKKPYPIEFGHRVLFVQDKAGFIVDFQVMGMGITDEKILIDTMKSLQERFNHKIKAASFDKGFWSPTNLAELSELVELPCLPKKGRRTKKERQREGTEEFGQVRKWHPCIESALHALGYGNGLLRCRDKGERGYERYVALGVLGRNLHNLGTVLLKNEQRNHRKKAA